MTFDLKKKAEKVTVKHELKKFKKFIRLNSV
jgi:hypothetical protein